MVICIAASDNWENVEDKADVEEHTLPSEELPAYDEIAANIEKSNAIGTMFTLYDCGANPKKSTMTSDVRQELAAVIYDTNVLGFKGPRKMHILIPGIYDVNTYERKSIRPVAVG
ncbi:hypothetical protein TELCIR_04539 [Teladorsagia circumcincta]|uniref:Tubby C-terminal domain-containing protein n=1 Tax=Teladorsagia circumcincta TaxID=45464 RepID=A0A2G9UTC2_TELCI|nr:hypothetical protein TELCIR_04539 [Teladorsagia circumcincta]